MNKAAADVATSVACGALVCAVALFAAGLALYHWTSGEATALLFAAPPGDSVLGVVAIVSGWRRTPRRTLVVFLGALVTLASLWMLAGEIAFFGTCWNWWDAASC